MCPDKGSNIFSARVRIFQFVCLFSGVRGGRTVVPGLISFLGRGGPHDPWSHVLSREGGTPVSGPMEGGYPQSGSRTGVPPSPSPNQDQDRWYPPPSPAKTMTRLLHLTNNLI